MVGYSFGGSINSNSYVLFSFSRKLVDDAQNDNHPNSNTESIFTVTTENKMRECGGMLCGFFQICSPSCLLLLYYVAVAACCYSYSN